MSDNSPLPPPPPITDREGTYNYRLKYKSNEEPYYYIKEYESDMKWYKKYIIIPVIILIILIIMGFIKSDVIVIVIGSICGILSGLVLWYFNTEYKNSKENRDRYIQVAKDKIEDEIKSEKTEEEKKEAEKKLIDKANTEKQEYIDKLTPENKKKLADEIKTNQKEILKIITEGDEINEISRKIIKYMNENQFSDYFFKNYKSDYLDPLIKEDDKKFKQKIDSIISEIQYYNNMPNNSISRFLYLNPSTKTDYSSNDHDYSEEILRYGISRK